MGQRAAIAAQPKERAFDHPAVTLHSVRVECRDAHAFGHAVSQFWPISARAVEILNSSRTARHQESRLIQDLLCLLLAGANVIKGLVLS